MNRQLQVEADKPVPQLNFGRQGGSRVTDDPLGSVSRPKLEMGDFRGAVRIACSEDSIADINSVNTIMQSSIREASSPL